MAESNNLSASVVYFTVRLKVCLHRYWYYVWLLLLVASLVLLYHFRAALRLYETVLAVANQENMMLGPSSLIQSLFFNPCQNGIFKIQCDECPVSLLAVSGFISTLTPKFYVALTGTSSLISGLILIFEWCYFRKYGTSFIEQVSVNHLRPLMGGIDPGTSADGFFPNTSGSETSRQALSECKVWRNPLNLFRGAEYNRYTWVTGKEPLTYHDMNLSAQDHQTFFTCDTDTLRPSDAVMQKAWRERSSKSRVKAAYQALEASNDCATAYILLAEEEATTISDAEKFFQQALKAAEGTYKKSQQLQHLGSQHEAQHNISLPKSATICYTAALLKARAVSDRFSPETASRRGLSTAEMSAVEAIHRAVEFNPHVPKYLLEMKSLIMPPEHILKRGDSEAVAYAFFHLQHWKRIEGALNLLHCTWEGTFRILPYPLEKGHLFYPYPGCTENADRELLPAFHEVSVYPKKELPFFIHFTAGLCSFTAMLAILTHQFPDLMGVFARTCFVTLLAPFSFILEKVENIMPSSLWHHLSRM
ncbi:suppressor of tumorigenicity 7 protein-like isoform X3 [Pyxicephalus adspersus]|uniref:suppressor of tumorigenicity 7 protein-like isoform X3 n=1 Tax=Pyxicephalus adspersus TaxID=30357 RepID=UPI003B5AB274